MPAASAIHAWPFIKLCTCQPRPGAFRHPAQSSQFRLQWYTCNRQAAPLRLSPAAQAVSTVATESSAQQQPLQSAQASQGHQRDTSSNTGNTSLQQQQVSNNLNSRPTADLLDPRSYEGTSDKARRKELVKYLASIPESEMTPEMLRRWRISKANRGKQAWNFGRRHPPETIAKITKRTKEAMLRPEVLQKVRENHPHASRILSPEAKVALQAKMTKAVTANHLRSQRRTPAKVAAPSKKRVDQPVQEPAEEPAQEPATESHQTGGMTMEEQDALFEAMFSPPAAVQTAVQSQASHQEPHLPTSDSAKRKRMPATPSSSNSSSTSSSSSSSSITTAGDTSNSQIQHVEIPLQHQASDSTSNADAIGGALHADETHTRAAAPAISSAPTGPANSAVPSSSASSNAPTEFATASTSAAAAAATPSAPAAARLAGPDQTDAQSSPMPAQSKQKSETHKRNISRAVKKKWADPGYRDKVLVGMRTEVTQTQRMSSYKASVMKKTEEGRGKLQDAKAKQDQLKEARQTVKALQLAVKAGQQQAEALRGDPEGYARQQTVLDTAQKLVTRAQAQVAAMEANTPSLEQVAAELGARPSTEQFLLSEDEQADADEASGGEHQGPESDNVSSSALQVLADRHWPDGSGSNHTASSHDVVDVTAASHAAQPPMWQSQQVHDIGTGNHAAGDTVQKAKKLQPV